MGMEMMCGWLPSGETRAESGRSSVEGVEHAVKLLAGMYFAEHIQLQSVGLGCQLAEFQVAEGRGNKQDGVGAMGACLQQLECVDDEVLAQAGKTTGLGSEFEIAQAALKKRLVGEHGKRSGASARHP